MIEGEGSLNTLIKTPHFDCVAREGVIFTNAFVPAPTCTPCRSAILSGQYFWQTGLGAILQGAVWDESIPTYPLILEQEGYHIGYAYKVWSPGRAVNAPYGGERTRYEPAGNNFRRFSHFATGKVPEMGIEGSKQTLLEETRQNFDAFLGARSEGKPFCYWWGPQNTHRTWERGSGKALWGLEPNDLKSHQPAFLPDVHEVREDVCDYLGECLAVDAGLGVLLERLEAIGELDDTLLVVSGDHGIPGIPRAKRNLYDIGCEVALAARWPGRIRPGRVVEDFINLMDLGPTFLEAAGARVPDSMSARSLMPVFESDKSGQIEETTAPSSSQGANGMSPRPVKATCPIPNVRSEHGTSFTFTTSPRTVGPSATPAGWMTRLQKRRLLGSFATIPLRRIKTWMPVRQRPG